MRVVVQSGSKTFSILVSQRGPFSLPPTPEIYYLFGKNGLGNNFCLFLKGISFVQSYGSRINVSVISNSFRMNHAVSITQTEQPSAGGAPGASPALGTNPERHFGKMGELWTPGQILGPTLI